MADKPILFSGPMVRAILAGRKSQTRRITEPLVDGRHNFALPIVTAHGHAFQPRYRVGDRLWVREAHYLTDDGDSQCAIYADDEEAVRDHLALISDMQHRLSLSEDWAAPHVRLRHGRFMPRWASRITLTVTSVRVERLQDISEYDALAEGVAPSWLDEHDNGTVHAGAQPTHRRGFARLWREIHGTGAWLANPWVAAYSFSADHRNIDAQEAA